MTWRDSNKLSSSSFPTGERDKGTSYLIPGCKMR